MFQLRSTVVSSLLPAILLLLVPSLPARAELGTEQLEALMNSSGLTEQLHQFEETILVQMMEGGGEAFGSEAVRERVENAVRSAYSGRRLQQKVRTFLESELTGGEVESVLEWLLSPLGARITQLEEEASTPQAYHDQKEIADFLVENLPAERKERYQQLDEAVRVSELGFTVGVNTFVAVAEGVALVAPGVESPSSDETRAQLEARREELIGDMKLATLRSFSYTYRDLEIADLDRYLEFAESSIGRRYHAVVSAAYERVLSEAARDLGLALGSASSS